MSSFVLTIPVVLTIFNRPHLVKRVFEEIRKAKPPKLYVIADGPRPDHPDDKAKCQATREIIETVDWDCQVFKNYSEVNLGCGKRTASGLDWVFSTEEQAIIFDDDCLPHQTLFRFYQEMLDRYRGDERIVSIGGNNYNFNGQRLHYSYHFSRFPHLWGWATWRYVWQKYYDFKINLWPEIRDNNWLMDIFGHVQAETALKGDIFKTYCRREDIWYWYNKFDIIHKGMWNTWDYQFFFMCLLQHGLAVLPNVNLVSNIGFGDGATHTCNETELANVSTEPMTFPLVHPPFMIPDAWADAYMQLIFNRSC